MHTALPGRQVQWHDLCLTRWAAAALAPGLAAGTNRAVADHWRRRPRRDPSAERGRDADADDGPGRAAGRREGPRWPARRPHWPGRARSEHQRILLPGD